MENSDDGQEILQGNKIDRIQLYSEIKFHAQAWDYHIARENANPAGIDIYSDGRVDDPRDWLNVLVRFLYGGEYE